MRRRSSIGVLLAALVLARAPVQAGAAVPSQDQAARRQLIAEAEAALTRGDAQAAHDAFQRAAQLEHAADIELGLVRSDMQAGEYRRALAFAAHVAGVHGDEPEGALAYAWLLLLGGQRAQAQRVLERALARLPQQSELLNLQRRSQQAAAFTPSDWMTPPLRLAPYALGDAPPPGARLVASALLIDAGRQALAPAAALGSAAAAWLRDGLGRTVHAALLRRDAAPGLALLRLQRPLASDAGLALAARDPFPGSPAWLLDHAADATAAPAWPWLLPGFLGSVDGDGSQRLGIALPGGSGGGPVLDAAGRLVGIALPQGGGRHALLPASALHAALGELLPMAQTPSAPRLPPDALYERGLRWTLQVLVTP